MTADSLFNVFGTTPAATSETNHDLKMTFNNYAMSRRDQPKHVIYRKRAVCQQFLEHYRKGTHKSILRSNKYVYVSIY